MMTIVLGILMIFAVRFVAVLLVFSFLLQLFSFFQYEMQKDYDKEGCPDDAKVV